MSKKERVNVPNRIPSSGRNAATSTILIVAIVVLIIAAGVTAELYVTGNLASSTSQQTPAIDTSTSQGYATSTSSQTTSISKTTLSSTTTTSSESSSSSHSTSSTSVISKTKTTSTTYTGSSSTFSSTAKVIATITNVNAIYLTYDVLDQPNLYAFGLGQASQSLIDTHSNTVTRTRVAEQPVVDPNTGYATLLGTSGNSNLGGNIAKWIAVYNPNGQLVANVTSPVTQASYIYGVTYDPQNNYVYFGVSISQVGPDNITIINAVDNKEVAGINNILSNTWLGLTYSNGYLYNVGTPAHGNEPASLQVINTTTNTIVNAISVATIATPVVNPSNGDVYLAGNDNITVASPTLHTISSISLGMSAGWSAFDPNTEQLYVSTGSNSVSVISATSNTVVQTLQVGKAPGSVIFDPRNGFVYVYDQSDKSVSVIQPQLGQMASVIATISNIDPQNYPAQFLTYDLLSQSNLWAYGIGDATSTIIYTESQTVSGRNASIQTIIDPNTGYGFLIGPMNRQMSVVTGDFIDVYSPEGSLIANVTTPQTASIAGIAYDPENQHLYVGLWQSFAGGENNITIFNTKTDSVVGAIADFNDVWGGLTYSGGYLYSLRVAGGQNGGSLHTWLDAINTTTNTVVNTLGGVYTNSVPIINPLNGELYIIGSNNITVTDPTLHQITSIPVATAYGTIAYDPVTTQFYVSGGYAPNNFVTVIDAQTNNLVQTLQVGNQPMSIIFNPGTSMIYVLNVNDQSISVIRP